MVTVNQLLRTWCRVNVARNKSVLELAEETSNVRLLRLLSEFSATCELVTAAFSCDAELVRAILRRSRSAARTHFGQPSVLLASRQFVTCTSSNAADLLGTKPHRPLKPDLAPGLSKSLHCFPL